MTSTTNFFISSGKNAFLSAAKKKLFSSSASCLSRGKSKSWYEPNDFLIDSTLLRQPTLNFFPSKLCFSFMFCRWLREKKRLPKLFFFLRRADRPLFVEEERERGGQLSRKKERDDPLNATVGRNSCLQRFEKEKRNRSIFINCKVQSTLRGRKSAFCLEFDKVLQAPFFFREIREKWTRNVNILKYVAWNWKLNCWRHFTSHHRRSKAFNVKVRPSSFNVLRTNDSPNRNE